MAIAIILPTPCVQLASYLQLAVKKAVGGSIREDTHGILSCFVSHTEKASLIVHLDTHQTHRLHSLRLDKLEGWVTE